MSIPVIMHGAAGRMGQRIIHQLLEAEDMAVSGGVDQRSGTLADLGLPSQAPLYATLPIEPGTVVIDFSHMDAFSCVVAHCRDNGMPVAIGTTGVEPSERDALLDAAAADIPVLWAPNMSVGVNVVMAVGAMLAKVLGEDYDIEITEAHHHHKVDAPSGTAHGIADAILEATGRTRDDLVYGREGQTGARSKQEIGVHALRMGDVVGDHSAYYVGNGERVVLSHQAHTRDIFAAGAVRAARFLHGAAPGRYTMAEVLGLGNLAS